MWRGLVLTVDPAAPPVSGADLRNWQNALALSEIGPVTLVSVRPVPQAGARAGDRIERAALTHPGEARAPALNRRRSRIDVRVTRSILDRLSAIVGDLKPDAIVVEGIPLFPFLEHLRPMTPMLVLDMHNIESDLAAQTAATGPGARLRARFSGTEADRIRECEREALALVDRVWVCSAADRSRLERLFGPGPPVDVVPNGIPRPEEMPAELPPLAGGAEGWPVLLFVGHLGYQPNIEAVGFLARQVFPRVREHFPAARLIIAGRSPGDAVAALAAGPAIELMADPADLSAVYGRAHLAVVPLTSAGGTRIKILEAAARGLPIVATPLAVEGLDLADGREVLLAETADRFAEHVRLLCGDPQRAEALRRNAQRTVLARFGPAAIAAAVRKGVAPSPSPGRSSPGAGGGDRRVRAGLVRTLFHRDRDEKPIILFFNKFFRQPVDVASLACGDACVFTNDRRKLKRAAAVVFHIPSLKSPKRIGWIRKRPDQLWIAWSQESRVNYPILDDAGFIRQFDLTMTYERSADIWHPYLPSRSAFELALAAPPPAKTATSPAALFQSAPVDRSGRNAFARELMTHMRIDSYGTFLNNRHLPEPDRGPETKQSVISAYKFCLAFENSIAEDYVTEKFFGPLLAGTVPVYLGAPNVGTFAPGADAFIDASTFSGPRELAEYLVHLDHHDDAYRRYLAWRNAGLSAGFVELLDRAREPFCRLGEIVLDRLPSAMINN